MLYLIPLLQSKLRFSGNLLGAKKQTDPKTTLITLGVIVLFFLVIAILNKVFGGSGALRQHKRVFKKKAREMDLSSNQIKLLINLIKEYNVKKPLMILSHPTNLDILLRKSIKSIKKESISDSHKQSRIITIYRIKHHLDKYQKSSQVKNTHEIQPSSKVVIERNDKKSYESSIIGNYENFFCIKLPTDTLGNQIKWKKGSQIKIVAFDSNGKESHFLSKSLGIKNVGKVNALIIAHTIKTTQNIARGLQRVDLSLSTYVYPVTKSFDRVKKRNVFKTNKNSSRIGKVLDISSGGCALSMKVPYSEGSFIELDFDLDSNTSIKLQGIILKLRMSKGKKMTHIKFTRASAKNLNRINNYIYSLG